MRPVSAAMAARKSRQAGALGHCAHNWRARSAVRQREMGEAAAIAAQQRIAQIAGFMAQPVGVDLLSGLLQFGFGHLFPQLEGGDFQAVSGGKLK